mgnify:CR=1 FL=1
MKVTPPGRIARSNFAPQLRGIWFWLPGLHTLRRYQTAWLRHDILAGLALTAVLVPVGMAYAQAARLPAIYGLYATIVPLLAYAIFGPSRILVLGPDSSLAPMIAAAILPLASGDPERAVALAGMFAIGMFLVNAVLAAYNITGTIEGPHDPKFKRFPRAVVASAVASAICGIVAIMIVAV